ncbi:competence protein ComFC [Clostridium algifaecis]|uniref:Competence protein ComFC n=1 Tax=Clostridium algifaecis TaxID=1472040 RepID=A0ABS4KS28_9CLOT|nr:ComF family protein [Clostridium algifaecis]MBP2032405.1 competence protein ComFC [Clostridium algifaecis]
MEYGIIESLKNLKDCILSVIYSGNENCILCNNELYSDKYICDYCMKSIMICRDKTEIGNVNGTLKFDCYSGAYYSGSMMELIVKLKYKSSFRSGHVIADYMYNSIKANKLEFDFITYVPMTKKDFKRRGFNQGEYLANILKEYTKKPVISCLSKIKSTKDQIGLSKRERWENIKGSFRFKNISLIKNKNVLIVDDVLTTGATAFYCALELKNNGANKITILTGAKSRV